ncbi:hypothetical protein D9B52_12000, partial [Corynebacterium diphtheriae]
MGASAGGGNWSISSGRVSWPEPPSAVATPRYCQPTWVVRGVLGGGVGRRGQLVDFLRQGFLAGAAIGG